MGQSIQKRTKQNFQYLEKNSIQWKIKEIPRTDTNKTKIKHSKRMFPIYRPTPKARALSITFLLISSLKKAKRKKKCNRKMSHKILTQNVLITKSTQRKLTYKEINPTKTYL